MAIKVLLPTFAADKDRVWRLKNEGRTASALNHPNILTVYDIGEIGDRPYLVIEFVQGITLRARVRDGPLPIDEAVHIATQVGEALRAAHGANIIHRDIKPENIMLRPDGLVKVLDFGLAKVFAGVLGDTALTQTVQGRIAGSLLYMSPEQLCGRDLDSRTDLWSVGVLLYEMVTGRVPFSGTPIQVAVSILERDVPQLPSDVPAGIGHIVFKALTKDREHRYSSARDLLDDLRGVRFRPQSSLRQRFRSVNVLRTASWVLGTGVAAAILFLVGFWVLTRRPDAVFDQRIPLTNSGDVICAAISQDGRYLAFATDSGQERRLWLRQISTQSNLVRASSQALIYTAISFAPDSKHLYYVAQKPDGSGELFRVPLIGGEARALIQDVDGAVALSPDGRQVAFVRHDPGSGQSRLMLANSDGTGERALATQILYEGFLEGNVAWSPDGKVIASAL